MKKEINVLDYASEIMNAVNRGVLLTAAADGKANTIHQGALIDTPDGIKWEITE